MSENTPIDNSFGGKDEVRADADKTSAGKRNAADKVNKEKDCKIPRDLDGKLGPQSPKKGVGQRDMQHNPILVSSADTHALPIDKPTGSKSVNVPPPGPQAQIEGPTNSPDNELYDLPELRKPRLMTTVQTPMQRAASYNRIKHWIAAKRAAGQMPPAPGALPIDKPSSSKSEQNKK